MPFPFIRGFFSAREAAHERIEPARPSDQGERSGMDFAPMSRTQLLQDNAHVLRKIRLCYGREPQQFEHDILDVVERYADFVNALPATPDNHHCFPGGLFRLGLETAFFSLQSTDAQIFGGRGTITQRRHLEPLWRHAAFVAGLCAQLQPLLNIVTVSTMDGNHWPSHTMPLSRWLDVHRHGRLHLLWSPVPRIDGLQTLYALPHIVPPAMMEHLADHNGVVVSAMLASLSRLPLPGPPATMTALVRRAAALAIDKEIRRMSAIKGQPLLGDHLARVLLDAMHDLVYCAVSWVPNSEKSRVWHAQDGTFVVWPGAGQDIAAHADRERLIGVPHEARLMLGALDGAGMIEHSPQGPICQVLPPGAANEVECIKLTVPELLLGGLLLTCKPLPPISARQHSQPPEINPAPPTSPGTPTTASPSEQLVLPLQGQDTAPMAATVVAEAAARAAAETPPAGIPNPIVTSAPALTNCLRLPADVAEVLRRSLASLADGGASTGAHLVDDGVLIPLAQFKAAHVDTRLAMRCLREADMLAADDSESATRTFTLAGSEVRGLVLKRARVTGLPPVP